METSNPLSAPDNADLSSAKQGKIDDTQDSLFNFQRVLPRLNKLIAAWEDERRRTELRRKQRVLDVNMDTLRQEGKLKADETFIPVRVIDTNIRREQPPFISFLQQSRRLAIFECLDKNNVDTESLEEDFTKGMTYNGWQKPFYKCLDGNELHGWDSVEIEYDESKPFLTNIDQVGHDKLIFPLDCKDIQACEILLREFDIAILKLTEFRDKFGFDPTQVNLLIEKIKARSIELDHTTRIYKYYCKFQGQVYVGWFEPRTCNDWLKAPAQLWRGRTRKRQVPDTTIVPTPTPDGQIIPLPSPTMKTIEENIFEILYPIRLLKYQEIEEPSLAEIKGRGWLDLPKQEAQTCLFTNFVNASCRASNVYGSPKNPSGTGAMPKRLNLDLVPGALYSEPFDFWSPPSPSFDLIRGAQALETQNQVESGQIATAAINNKDSRKTAKEIETSVDEKGQLDSVAVTLFSTFLREVYSDCWLMIQNFALNNKFPFSQIESTPAILDPTTGQVIQEAMMVNDEKKISLTYSIKAAGDIDVIARKDKLQKRAQLWPIIANTPLAMPFLVDMIKEMLPEDAVRYEQILRQAMQQQNAVANLLNVIQASSQEKRPPTPQEVLMLEQSYGGQSSGQGQGQGQTPPQQTQQPKPQLQTA